MTSRRRAGYNALLARAFTGSLSLALFALAGQAAPFKPTPASFASWYNATQKQNRKVFAQDIVGKPFVQDLAECSHTYYTLEPILDVVTGGDYENYSCNFGYVTITNPMGKAMCELSKIWWEKNLKTENVIVSHYEKRETCRWKN